MHYLPCNHCGHLNEAKSEYVVLCEKCGKKMENTYAQWKESRSHGTYSEYLAECCIDEAILEESRRTKEVEKAKKSKAGTVALILGVVAVVFIGIAIIGYGGIIRGTFQDLFGSGAGLEWSEQHVGTEGLVVNFPKTFENADALTKQLPPTARSHFEKLEASIAGFNKNFIALAFTMVTNESDTGNLRNYAEIGLGLLTGTRAINKTDIQTEEYTIDGNPAILQRGTFVTEGETGSSFTMLLVGKERNFWLVMVVAPTEDGKAQRITKKFIRSIKIKPEEY